MTAHQKIVVTRGGSLGGFYIRPFSTFSTNPADARKGHKHYIDHVTLVLRGRALFTVEDESVEAGPGEFVLARAGYKHSILPLEPHTDWACLFAEYEVMKWLDQQDIRDALANLKEGDAQAASAVLQRLIIPGDMPDWVLSGERVNFAGART